MTTNQKPYAIIKSFEDACKTLNREPILPGVEGIVDRYNKWLIDTLKLATIVEAINSLIPEPAGEFPNWHKQDQYKYHLWSTIEATAEEPGGVGFSGTRYVISFTASALGSRFCLKESAAVYYIWATFPDLCKEYFLIIKTTNS